MQVTQLQLYANGALTTSACIHACSTCNSNLVEHTHANVQYIFVDSITCSDLGNTLQIMPV